MITAAQIYEYMERVELLNQHWQYAVSAHGRPLSQSMEKCCDESRELVRDLHDLYLQLMKAEVDEATRTKESHQGA